jgi:hypothetical protein
MSADVAKALARVSSGLYVVSASHNNATSAMVASWVSQASFEPLGLTVAVAKDRAIESMMQVGDGHEESRRRLRQVWAAGGVTVHGHHLISARRGPGQHALDPARRTVLTTQCSKASSFASPIPLHINPRPRSLTLRLRSPLHGHSLPPPLSLRWATRSS